MRIGLIAPPWLSIPPPSYGGIEEVLAVLAEGLRSAGHQVTLFATGDSTCRVPIRWVYRRAVATRMGAQIPELCQVLAAYDAFADADVIHDHTIVGPVIAAARGDHRVVTTNHAPFTPELRQTYGRIHRQVAIVAISRDQASRARGIDLAGVIHHGLEADGWPPGRGSGGHLLFLGRMAPEKGPHRAIRVARAAGHRILLAAKQREPAERRFFAERVEPLLGDDAEYLGEIDRPTKVRLLGEAAALVNPIRWPEPFGLVMIEALATGTPVITFAEGAAPEIVEHGVTGFVCADEAEMVEAVGRIPEIDREACRRGFEQRFTAEKMVRAHLSLYQEVIRRRETALAIA